MKQKAQESRGARPYVLAGVILLVALVGVVVYAYVDKYAVPPRQVAVRVQDSEYTRGDVVNFIRFNQRLSEDLGIQFEVGTSLFEALQSIQDNEMARRAAPALGVTVSNEQVHARVEQFLGFPGLTEEERKDPALSRDIEEAKRQFLNRVSLSEEEYLGIIRLDLFKEAVREVVAQDVPRIQPQVLVYEIVLTQNSPQEIQRIERALASGDSAEKVALEFSQDPNVQRTKGSVGWLPRRVIPELEELLWGTKADGTRNLPLNVPSAPQFNSEAKTYNVYIVTELSEARELADASFQKLADEALKDFLSERRRELSATGDLYMALDDKIYNWVNRQVRLASLLPTPTPISDVFNQLAGQ
jgi:hypothetical protein